MKKLLSKLGIESPQDFWAFCLQFLKFGMIGIVNTGLTLALQYGLMWLIIHYIPAYIIAFLLTVINSFFWNSRFVFRVKGDKRRQFLRMLCCNLVTLLVGTGFMALLVEVLQVSENLAPILNLLLTVPLNFLLTKFWAFRAP